MSPGCGGVDSDTSRSASNQIFALIVMDCFFYPKSLNLEANDPHF